MKEVGNGKEISVIIIRVFAHTRGMVFRDSPGFRTSCAQNPKCTACVSRLPPDNRAKVLTSILGSDILRVCQVCLAKGGILMNREEILAKSKLENRGQDIASLEVSRSSMLFGWIAAVCLLALVAVVEALVYNRMNNGIFFAVMAGCSAIFVNKYLRLRKRHELCIAVVYIVATVAFLIAWILQLAK